MFLETSQRHISQAEDVASLLDSVGVPKAKVGGWNNGMVPSVFFA